MNAGYKHSTLWSFGDIVWHKATKDKGLIIGIVLEFELTSEQPVEAK